MHFRYMIGVLSIFYLVNKPTMEETTLYVVWLKESIVTVNSMNKKYNKRKPIVLPKFDNIANSYSAREVHQRFRQTH